MTFSPGDKVRLVHDGRAVEATVQHDGCVEAKDGHIDKDLLAALGFRVEPVPLEEPPVGGRVRVRWPDTDIFSEYVHESDSQLALNWHCPSQGWADWSDLAFHVVAIGEPSFEWREVTR